MKNIKDILHQDFEFIDVFFDDVPANIQDFFHGAKPVQETYQDTVISFTEYTPNGQADRKIVISADRRRKTATRKRYDYIERFKKNKYADIELVEALVLSNAEKIAIHSHFHIGDLSSDYAETRIKSYGNNIFFRFQETVDKMDEIVSKARNGAILRVWYGHNAEDLCGLMSLLHRLKNIDCTIIELELPDQTHMLNAPTKKRCRYWGQFDPEDLCIPISGAKLLTDEKKNALVMRWQELVSENTEYRIYEAGELKSVDFEYLRAKAIPHFYKNKFSLTRLMERLLKKEEAFKDLGVVTFFPDFIYRLIDVGDLAYLGRRVNIFEEDCWLKSLR